MLKIDQRQASYLANVLHLVLGVHLGPISLYVPLELYQYTYLLRPGAGHARLYCQRKIVPEVSGATNRWRCICSQF